MPAPIEPRPCAFCGEPAVDARVETNGDITYLCETHARAPTPGLRSDQNGGNRETEVGDDEN